MWFRSLAVIQEPPAPDSIEPLALCREPGSLQEVPIASDFLREASRYTSKFSVKFFGLPLVPF